MTAQWSHLRFFCASERVRQGRTGFRQGAVTLPVNHLRTQDDSEVLLTGVTRAGERQNFAEGPPEAILRQVPLPRANHLRTEEASQVLLTGVARAGEGIMVSPAHPMCPTGTSNGGHPRR